MGYRTYLGTIPKREYNKIKSLTKKELHEYYNPDTPYDEEDFHVAIYDITTQLYELGKYYDFKPPKGSTLPFFKKKEMKETYEHYGVVTVSKEFFAAMINYQAELIKEYLDDYVLPFFTSSTEHRFLSNSPFLEGVKTTMGYDLEYKYEFDFNIITPEQQTAIYKMIQHMRSIHTEWGHKSLPFDLDNDTDKITTSWKYEYAIFELIRIYKSFDWKRDVLVYYGY